MNVTVSGASGFIGRQLLTSLAEAGHSLLVLSRRADAAVPPGVDLAVWDPERGAPPGESLRQADAIVHLAGEPVAQRWTPPAKARIRESRVAGTRNLVEALAKQVSRPEVLVCASAIGYYGSRGDHLLDESAAPGQGFLAEVCAAWEREARAAEALGIRVVRVRIGIALEPRGGALARMLPPFRLGAGGPLGSGKQWMSWIHASDLTGLIRYAVENPVSGAVNATAPFPVTNSEFSRALGQVLHRPAILPAPAFALRLAFGEMAEVLLASQRVLPRAAEGAGFRFQFPQLRPALGDLLT